MTFKPPLPIRPYVPELIGIKSDGTKQYRQVIIGNALAPWRKWREEGEPDREKNWTGLPSVDVKSRAFEFNRMVRQTIGTERSLFALGLKLWRRM